MVNVYVRRMVTGEIVKTIDVRRPSERNHEKFLMGLMRNMNLEDYWVDDSEVTLAEQQPATGEGQGREDR
jgi:hypothetical protein